MPGKPLYKKPMKNNVFVRFDPETDDLIRDMALTQDRPVTRVVRELVREALTARGLIGPQRTKRAANG